MDELRPTEGMDMGATNGGAAFDDHMNRAGEPTDEQERANARRTEEAALQRPRGEGVMFTDLPDSCLCLIVSHLGPNDVARGACVCQEFRDALDSDSVWDQFVPKSAVNVASPNDELKAATKKKIFSFLRKPFLLRETLAYWLDSGIGGVCYSMAAKGLRIVWGEDHRYWYWAARPGARWPEVACLRQVCWFHASGSMKCELPPGTYTLSWRIQYQLPLSRVPGWDHAPTEFSVSTTDGSQRATTHRYLTNHEVQQGQLGDLTPVRRVQDRWLEFDAGEVTVVDEQSVTSLEFSMVETESGSWKRGIVLDGVVLRPSALARITGQYVSVEDLSLRALHNEPEEDWNVEGLPAEFQDCRGRVGWRGPANRGFPPRGRLGVRQLLPDHPPQFDAGEN